MKILLTLDYELFNGKDSGTVVNSIIIPMNELNKVLDKHQSKITLFVDTCFLNRLKLHKETNINILSDWETINAQLQEMAKKGHDLQLHLHPNWFHAQFLKDKWYSCTDDYKLSDLSRKEVEQLFVEGIETLQMLGGGKAGKWAFRAGAYCLQTLSNYAELFAKYGISIDSSVFRNRKSKTKKWEWYDFTSLPKENVYHFSNDITQTDSKGKFVEVTIPTFKISFIRLFIRYMLRKTKKNSSIQTWGDGTGSLSKLDSKYKNIYRKIKSYITPSYSCASIDRSASDLESLYQRAQKRGDDYFLIMGHPKSFSKRSIEQFDEFLNRHPDDESITISKYVEQIEI